MSVRFSQPRHVLVIDDDSIMLELLSALLPSEGFTVSTAVSGDQALALLASTTPPPNIILVDLHMPGLHGLDLVRRLLTASPAGTLLLGMSASPLDPLTSPLFHGFLRKPFGPEDFARAVDAAFTKTAPAPEADTPAARPTPILDDTIYNRLAVLLPPAQLRELYRITLDDVHHRLGLMQSALDRNDFAEYHAEAHAIKGGCGMVGATELSALAARAEAGSPQDTPPLPEFHAACTRLRGMLDERL